MPRGVLLLLKHLIWLPLMLLLWRSVWMLLLWHCVCLLLLVLRIWI
jgi:hypothetical protein